MKTLLIAIALLSSQNPDISKMKSVKSAIEGVRLMRSTIETQERVIHELLQEIVHSGLTDSEKNGIVRRVVTKMYGHHEHIFLHSDGTVEFWDNPPANIHAWGKDDPLSFPAMARGLHLWIQLRVNVLCFRILALGGQPIKKCRIEIEKQPQSLARPGPNCQAILDS